MGVDEITKRVIKREEGIGQILGEHSQLGSVIWIMSEQERQRNGQIGRKTRRDLCHKNPERQVFRKREW